MTEFADFSPHTKNDPAWGGPCLRRCPGCRPRESDFHELDYFIKGPDDTYSVLCRICHLKQQKIKAQIGMDEAATSIVAAVSAASVRAKKDGFKFDPFQRMFAAAGGADKVYDGVGRVVRNTLRNATKKDAKAADLDRAIKISKTMLDHASTVAKNKPTMFDLSGFTEEETAELIMAMIHDNKTLRIRILGDPEIRKILLAELDITVIEHAVEDKQKW